ncbi:MAG: DMT family transporter [Candidatus Peregrinibacteria bacterium]
MPLSETRKGELSIFLSTLLWSLFPVITILTFSGMGPMLSSALSTLFGALFFAIVLTVRGRWRELKMRSAWKDILLASVSIGIIFYGLMFLGLAHTTAGNASIVSLMEIFFSFLILGVIVRHEHLPFRRILGAVSMALGAAVILAPKSSGWHSGDLLVLLATVFGPIGNFYAQRARRAVSAECIMFFRSVFSGLFLLCVAMLLEPIPSGAAFAGSFWFLVINGILLFGLSKILWIDGIHHIPITKAISLESMTPALTLLVAFFALGEPIMKYQILGFVPIVLGIWLLMRGEQETAGVMASGVSA